jgi:hypothetical protein
VPSAELKNYNPSRQDDGVKFGFTVSLSARHRHGHRRSSKNSAATLSRLALLINYAMKRYVRSWPILLQK